MVQREFKDFEKICVSSLCKVCINVFVKVYLNMYKLYSNF